MLSSYEAFELREEKLKKEMAILEQCLQNEKDICKKQKDYIELQRTKLEERLKKDEVSMIEHEKMLSEILQSNTYILMRKYVENPIKSKMKESAINWEELRKKIDFCFPQLFKVLNKDYLLTQQEIKICIMTKLNFTTKEISIILNTTIQAISMAKSRAYGKRFDGKATAKKWDELIRSL